VRGFVPLILLVSLLYASTYLFIKVAVEELAPAVLVEARLLLAAPIFLAILVASVGARPAVAQLRAEWRGGIVLGATTLSVPVALIAFGEQWVTSGVAAVAVATTPIFVQLLAYRFRPDERARGLQLAGIVLGLAGVALLTGAMPEASWDTALGLGAILAAALCFAVGMLYAQTRLEATSVLTIATASTLGGAAVMLPFAAAQLPGGLPSAQAIGAVLGLTLLNSLVSQFLSWHLVDRFGSTRNSLQAYLTPPFALLLGALVLDETVTLGSLAALALILVGVGLGSGVVRIRPARDVAPEAT
jgi:drug/metabolite transporter (DMT)-like permease